MPRYLANTFQVDISDPACTNGSGKFRDSVVQAPSESIHLTFLDGLRALAALVVIFHHAWLESWPAAIGRPVGLLGLLTGWLAYGKLAVTAFIVLSGFCLMLPVVRYGKEVKAKRFLMRRARRILPPYYAAFLLALLLDLFVLSPASGTNYASSFPLTASGIISHLFLLQNFTLNPYEVQGPLWSIAVECQIYLFFPAFIWVYKRWGVLATVAVTTCLGYSTSYLAGHAGFPNSYAHYIAMFGLGMLAAELSFKTKRKQERTLTITCYALLPILAIVGAATHHKFGSNKLITDGLMGLMVSTILVLSTLSPIGWISQFLSLKPFVRLGEFSYSLYLIHNPLQEIIWTEITRYFHLTKTASFLFLSTLGTVIIVVIAYGFFYLLERPYLKETADGKLRVALAEEELTVTD